MRINFSIPVTLFDFRESENSLYSYAKLKIFYVGETEDRRLFTKSFSDRLLASLPYVPVVGYYDDEKEDFLGHNPSIQHIYGIVPEDTNIEYVEENDREYAVCDVILYTGRVDKTGEIAQKIIGKQHSLELNPRNTTYVVNRDGKGKMMNIEFKSGTLLGLSILGDDEKPAFEGSEFFDEHSFFIQMFNGFKEQLAEFSKNKNKRGETMNLETGIDLEKDKITLNEFEEGESEGNDNPVDPGAGEGEGENTGTGEGTGEGEGENTGTEEGTGEGEGEEPGAGEGEGEGEGEGVGTGEGEGEGDGEGVGEGEGEGEGTGEGEGEEPGAGEGEGEGEGEEPKDKDRERKVRKKKEGGDLDDQKDFIRKFMRISEDEKLGAVYEGFYDEFGEYAFIVQLSTDEKVIVYVDFNDFNYYRVNYEYDNGEVTGFGEPVSVKMRFLSEDEIDTLWPLAGKTEYKGKGTGAKNFVSEINTSEGADEENFEEKEDSAKEIEENSVAALNKSERAELEAFRRERKLELIQSFEEDLNSEVLEELTNKVDSLTYEELDIELSREFTKAMRENNNNKKPKTFIYTGPTKRAETEAEIAVQLVEKYKNKN